jgi:uncharacterized membrane protein YsdA (DUF1294 family)
MNSSAPLEKPTKKVPTKATVLIALLAWLTGVGLFAFATDWFRHSTASIYFIILFSLTFVVQKYRAYLLGRNASGAA